METFLSSDDLVSSGLLLYFLLFRQISFRFCCKCKIRLVYLKVDV